MPEYGEINKDKQLLVDGNDASWFFSALLQELSIAEIQIQNYGGNDELRGFLKQFSKAPGFSERVKSLGIVRDAENTPKGAFQSVLSALRTAKLPVPKSPSKLTNTRPQVSVFIVPDAQTNGMLETICLRSVEDDPAISCIDEYFSCLEERLGFLPSNMEKARLQAFLSSRKKVHRMLGIAAKQGIWPWNSPAFESMKDFVKAL